MSTMKGSIANVAVDSSACDFCPRSVDCQNLKTAVCILEREASSASQEQRDGLSIVKEIMQETGYSFPNAKDRCFLSQEKEVTRALVEMAVDLLKKCGCKSRRA